MHYEPGVTKYGRESRIMKFPNGIAVNGSRGFWAGGIFIAVRAVAFFIAYMTASGNDTPMGV